MRGTMQLLVVSVCAALCGCATAGRTISTSEGVSTASQDIDAEKVATVNQWGQAHGATIVWINYPVRAHPRSAGTAGGD